MPHALSFLPAATPLLLQAAELTKAGGEALSALGKHNAADPVRTIQWVIMLALGGMLYWQWKEARTATATKDKAVADALKEARSAWALEMATNIGAADEVKKQMVQQYEKEINRLQEEKRELAHQLVEVNKELRQQLGNDARVLEATANTLRINAKGTQAANANLAEVLRVLQLIAPPSANVRPAILIDLT